MKYKGTKTLEVLEGADNYNRWIADRIRKHINSPALEIGAGTGNISEELLKVNDLTLTDNDPELLKILGEKFSSNKKVRIEQLDISKDFSKVKNRFKTVYSVNVLEHIKDDRKALINMHKLLEIGGRVVVLVPANKRVFSYLDRQLGHYRRYEKKELWEKLNRAGFEDIKINFFNIAGLLSWYVRDKIDRKNSHLNPSHVRAFDWIVPILEKIEPKENLPAGISLIAVGVKK